MAGHGEADEGDFWPGYVDALTAMVKVLSFVMMLMATAVFVLSQNISKEIVQRIAEAAKVDRPDDENIDALTERILAKVSAENSGKNSPPVPVNAAPESSAPASQETTTTPVASQDKSQASSAAAVAAQGEARKAGETKEVAVAAADTTKREPKDTSFQRDALRLTLNFPDRQSTFDDKTKTEIENFVGEAGLKNPSSRVLIQAMAYAGAGALSEVRRVAFHRAMLVRQKLTQSGVAQENITLKVVDTTNENEAPQLNILVQ